MGEYGFGTEDGWTVEYGNTGGGVMCWVASHPLRTEDDQVVYFGTSGDVWAWDTDYGESFGTAGESADGRLVLVPAVPSDVPAADPRVREAIVATLDSWIF